MTLAADQRTAVLDLLATQRTPSVDLPVRVGVIHPLPARLLAVHVPPEVVDQSVASMPQSSAMEARRAHALWPGPTGPS